MQNLYTSIIRTTIPYIVGAIGTFLVNLGVDFSPELQFQLGSLLTFAFGTLYYVIVRYIARKHPKLEWLLGVPVKPEYK